MKAGMVKKATKWIVGFVLLAGLVYSTLTLTVGANHVYASSCDCQEAAIDASDICFNDGQFDSITSFSCPVGVGQDQFTFTCGGPGNPNYGPYTAPCSL